MSEDADDVSVDEMLENMGEPSRPVSCPIDGCDYEARSAKSIAAHVSSSSLDRHVWANTDYIGWRAFVRAYDEEPGEPS